MSLNDTFIEQWIITDARGQKIILIEFKIQV